MATYGRRSGGGNGLTPAQEAKLDALDYDDWFTDQVNFMASIVPTLTTFLPIKPGGIPLGQNIGAVTNDSLVDGGGMSGPNATGRNFTNAIFNACNTGAFGVAMRAQLLGPTAARRAQIGLSNAANSHVIAVETAQAVDATHYNLHIVGAGTTDIITDGSSPGSSSVLTDLGWHDFVITKTAGAGTVRLHIDQVLAATTTNLANISDEAMYLYLFNTVLQDAKLARAAIGFASP